MTQRTPSSNSKLDKAMNVEQFEQVVEAIVAGKYSWACVLILRFAGYNPLHYIPYRTYNRLTKENCQVGIPGRHQTTSMNTGSKDATTKHSVLSSQKSLNKINDLSYLEVLDKQNSQARGGNSEGLFCSQNDNFHFFPNNISWFIQPDSEYEITAKAPGTEEIYLPYGAASKVFQSESFKELL